MGNKDTQTHDRCVFQPHRNFIIHDTNSDSCHQVFVINRNLLSEKRGIITLRAHLTDFAAESCYKICMLMMLPTVSCVSTHCRFTLQPIHPEASSNQKQKKEKK